MSSIQSIESSQDYVNYTFNLTSRGITETTSELAGMSSTITNLVGLMAFKTAEYLSSTESLIVSLGYAATAVFTTATQQAIRFQQALADVKAIGGESINEIAIGQAAMKYSNKFGGTETENGARAGFILYYKTLNGTNAEQKVYWDIGNEDQKGTAYGTFVDASIGAHTNSKTTHTTKCIINGFDISQDEMNVKKSIGPSKKLTHK